MKLQLLISLCAALSLVSLALAKASETSAVLDLTKTSDFDKAIGKGTPALVEFFAPWCGHCKKLAPTYEELASAYAGNKKQSVIIAKVDADANRELGQRFGVQGFPTLMWFKANDITKPETYSGPRDLNGMKNYIQEMSGAVGQVKPLPPSPVTQLTAANFDSIVNDPKKDAFVEFYAPWCGHCKNLAPIWDQLAQTFQNEPNCVIGQMDADNPANKEVAAKYGVSGFPTLSVSAVGRSMNDLILTRFGVIQFFPKGSSDKKSDTYMQSRTLDDLVSFVNSKCMTFRTAGGGLSELAGRMPLLDTLASKFFMAKEEAQRMSVWEETKAFVERVSKSENATAEKDTAAQYYIKVSFTLGASKREPAHRLYTLLSHRSWTRLSRSRAILKRRRNVWLLS